MSVEKIGSRGIYAPSLDLGEVGQFLSWPTPRIGVVLALVVQGDGVIAGRSPDGKKVDAFVDSLLVMDTDDAALRYEGTGDWKAAVISIFTKWPSAGAILQALESFPKISPVVTWKWKRDPRALSLDTKVPSKKKGSNTRL